MVFEGSKNERHDYKYRFLRANLLLSYGKLPNNLKLLIPKNIFFSIHVSGSAEL